MEIKNIKTKNIKPYWNNPRKNDASVSAVAESIRQFGFQQPIVVDSDNVIICGHTRYKAALKLGLEEVPCKTADELSDEQIKAYRLIDNKTAELSAWDDDKLICELKDLSSLDLGIDLELFGFDINFECGEAKEDDFDIEDAIKSIDIPITKTGDMWKLGRHRLLCGDSTNENDVNRLLGENAVNLYITDPPYNVDYKGKAGKLKNDNMKSYEFGQFLFSAFSNAKKHMMPGASFYIFYPNIGGENFYSALRDAELNIHQCLIWVKNMIVVGRSDYQWKHEPCFYGWKEGAPHFWNSDRKQSTVLEFDKPSRSANHPTIKPVKMFDYLIQNSTQKSAIVFDGFAGSGTTLLACEQNNRISFNVELDEKFCDVIIKRWEALTGKKAELIKNGTTEN